MTPLCRLHSIRRLPSRLLCVIAFVALPALAGPAQPVTANMPHCASGAAPRIATMDWMVVETLIALGAPPVGAAQLQAYDKWVGTTTPPERVTEIGLRSQPNLELLSQIAPDRILMSPRFIALEDRLSQIAPVTVVSVYMRDGPVWPNLLAATRKVAALACRPAAGERLVQTVSQALTRLKQQRPEQVRPLLIMQFVDKQHVRIFGAGSLYNTVLNQLGLDNAWDGGTNAWGYSLAGIDALMQRDIRKARMIVVEPLPTGLKAQLAGNGLWQHLPAVRRRSVLRIPEVWSFGGLPSARRFAELITQALARPEAHAFRPGTPQQSSNA